MSPPTPADSTYARPVLLSLLTALELSGGIDASAGQTWAAAYGAVWAP